MAAADDTSRRRPGAPLEVDTWLKVAAGFFLLLCLFYALPVLPEDTRRLVEYRLVELPLLGLVVLLSLTAARRAPDSATRNFWALFGIAHACWLVNVVGGLAFGDADAGLATFVKDLFYLAMYCLLVAAVDLRPGLLKSDLQRLRARLAALASVAVIVGIFGYFALVPALAGLADYESPYVVYAVLDAYVGLRFLAQALVSHSRSWRRIQFLLAAAFALIVVADLLVYAYRVGILEYRPGQALNLVWFLYCVPMFLATRVRPGAPQVLPWIERGDWSDSLNLAPLLAYGVAIPLVHLAGYGFGLLPEASHELRDLFVLAWLVAATGGIAWQYLLLRARLARAERARLAAEQEKVSLQAQLRQSQRIELMGQLSGGLAHEFGNSLFGAESFAQRILNDARRPGSAIPEEHAQNLVRALAGSRELISKFGVLGRDQDPDAAVIDVVEQVRNTLDLLRPGLGRGITLDLSVIGDDLLTIARAQDLQQITINLVLNARDAVGAQGRIDVQVGQGPARALNCTSCGALLAGEHLHLSVTDSGPGVDATLRQRIFEPLITSKPAGRGSGLGLSIVHTIVHQLRGHLLLEDDGPCTFSVLLPAVTLGETGGGNGRAGRLLIVEIDGVLRDAVRRNAALHGLHVNHVSSVDAAKVILDQAEQAPDLLLLGNVADPIDVAALLAHVRQRPGLRRVLCCRQAQRALVATQAGLDAILEPPVDDERFAAALLGRVGIPYS